MGTAVFFPVAAGKLAEKRKFYVTHNPQCSSLFEPNEEFFGGFSEFGKSLEVERTLDMATVALDAYLPSTGISSIDFLQIDVQGAELEVLQGGESFLRSSVLGLSLEIEFSPLYREQPLFSEIDPYVRSFGFQLFDLSRVWYRRKALPRSLDTRGQLLWGDALYLRDYKYFTERQLKVEALKLAALASVYGFHDYAAEILNYLLDHDRNILDPVERAEVFDAKTLYFAALADLSTPAKLLRWCGEHIYPPLEEGIHRAISTGSHRHFTHWSD
ncbi:MAG: hypothetical protein NVSMB52_12320 [Chloroflexota bacterium]